MKPLRFLQWIATTYLIYVVLCLLVIMPAMNFAAPPLARDALDRTLRTELILFNPFTLNLQVRKLELSEPDDEDRLFAAFDTLDVNLSLASLVSKGWVFDAIELQGLHGILRRTGADSLNISDLLTSEDTDAAPSETTEIPGISIGELVLHARRLTTSDETRSPAYETHWNDLAIAVRDFSTLKEAGQPYRLEVTTEAGGRLYWEGDLSIPGTMSEGRVVLSDAQLRTPWRYAKPWLTFEVDSGTLAVEAHYSINWADTPIWSLSQGTVSIDNLNILPIDRAALPDTYTRMESLKVSGIEIDSASSSVTVDSFTTDGISLSGFSEEERVSLVDLFDVQLPDDESGTAADPEPQPTQQTPEWTVALAKFENRAGAIDWRSEMTKPALTQVRGIKATATDINWPAAGPSPMTLALVVNDQSQLAVQGQLHIGSGDGNFDYSLQALPLELFAPLIPEVLNAEIRGGNTSLKGTVALSEFNPTNTQLEGEVDTLQVVIHEETDAISGWDSFRWRGLNVDIVGQTVTAQKLLLDGYTGRLHIREDGTINSQRLLQSNSEEDEDSSGEAQSPSESDAELAGKNPADEAPGWQVSVPEIVISDSSIDFKDESLPINFQAVIGDLNGDITGLSTDPASTLAVDLKGSVEGYAPVTLGGTVKPFAEQPEMGMGLTFEGVDLVLLTPYSSTYAGYDIERGLLNLDLEYSLENNRLQGDNKVVVDQLKLGDRVESDRAVDLPIELALALLTDINGVIDLAVPVSGDLADPQFSIGSVIAGAFVNLITKAVTAPFSLLANLVGTEDDLERVVYNAGSPDLDEPGKTKLTELAGALEQRPSLQLIIKGRFNRDSDGRRMQVAALNADLMADGLSQDDIDARSDRFLAAVERRYKRLDNATDETPTHSAQRDAVLATYPVDDSTLADLALARATNAKAFLVNDTGLDADRAVIDGVDATDEANRVSGIEFAIDQ